MAKPIYIYTGTEWVPVGPQIGNIAYNWIYTATGGETSLSGTDDNGLTLSYTPNYEQVYLNGVLLVRGTDYNAASSSSITGLTALTNGDVINILVLEATTVDNTYTQNQTDLLLNDKLDISSASATYLTQTSASATYAPLSSPALTGTPTAPLADQGDMSSQLANTQFVNRELLPVTQFAAAGSDLLNLPSRVHPGEKLLKEAVYYIDAAHESAGDQEISNLGWGGDVLNTRSGSSTAEDSNDPKFLDWDGENYVYLPGVTNNRLTVPDETALNITADIDIRVQVALDDWTPGSDRNLLHKFSIPRSYALQIKSTGELILYWSTDGTNVVGSTSTAIVQAPDGSALWVRATLDVDNGASGRDVKFYTSNDGVSWSQLGTTVTTAGVTSIYPGTTILAIGAGASTGGEIPGKFYRAQILDGIDGVPVLDVDTSLVPNGTATTFPALTGQTVTINRSTSGRKSVAVCHPQWLLGTDDYMEVDNKHFDANSVAGYAALPGLFGSNLSVADEAALDITGDIDLRARVALDDWNTGFQRVISKDNGSDKRSYYLRTDADTLRIFVDDDGSGSGFTVTSVSHGFSNGSTHWIRGTVDLDNGSGNSEFKFFTSDDGETWTQLGTTQTLAVISGVYVGTEDVVIGGSSINVDPLKGKVFRAQVFDGIDGTKVLDVDPTTAAAGDTSFSALTGQTVSVNGQARLAPHGFVYLPGVTGNYLSVPDSAALDVTGDLDIRCRVALDDWTPSSPTTTNVLVSKRSNHLVASSFSYTFGVQSTGVLALGWHDGSTSSSAVSTVSTNLADGSESWVRATLDVDNGAGGYDVKFYLSSDGSSWTQLGSTVTGGATTSIQTTTSPVEIGSQSTATNAFSTGRIYRAQVLDGIDGTIALDVDCSQLTGDVDSFTEASENAATVTVNRSGSAYRSVGIVRSGYVLPGAVNVFRASEVSLLDFGASDSFTVLAVVRQWGAAQVSRVLWKGLNTTAPYWGLNITTSNTVKMFTVSGTVVSPEKSFDLGSVSVITGVVDRSGNVSRVVVNDVASTDSSLSAVGDMSNSEVMRVGLAATGTNFAEVEGVAFALFRRALNSGEITALNNYFQGRIGG